MLDGLIDGEMEKAIAASVGGEEALELRVRIGAPLKIRTLTRYLTARLNGEDYIASREDVDKILARATDMSPYSVSDELKSGYVPFRSARIGVGGECVSENGNLLAIKSISYLVIRIPRQVFNAAGKLLRYVANFDASKSHASVLSADYLSKKVKSALIISLPGAGKTTALRDLARVISHHKNVVVIDERKELALPYMGEPTLDIGEADVISGMPKLKAYENCVRAMNPDVIVTDEIFGEDEVKAVCDMLRCGVKVFASLHGESVEAVRKSKIYSVLLENFEFAATLEPIGKVKEAVTLNGYN